MGRLAQCLCQVQLDYSSLRREHTAVSSTKERDKLSSQFQADIEERAALLAKVAPNLKAMEQYEAVKVCFTICPDTPGSPQHGTTVYK